MNNEIEIICELAGCSIEEATKVWEETGDIVESVDRLLPGKAPLKKPKIISEDQQKFNEIRKLMESMDKKKEESTLLNQPDCVEQVEQQDHHEEMVLQNNCYQQCQIPSLEEEVGKQGIVCQSQSECFCDSQLNVQK